MARPRTIEAGAINVRVHPHSAPDIYNRLIQDAYKLRRPLRSRADQMLLMSSISPIRSNNQIERIDGVLARFTNINTDDPWFNLNTSEEAEENDVREINIPDYLRPNYQPFSFSFFPSKHLFVFERRSVSSSISHGIVESYLTRLLSDSQIIERYGEVNVDTIRDHQGLEDIFNIFQLKHLEIIIKRPNPDDLSEYERVMLDRMNRQNINKIEERLSSIPGQSISPDENTKALANVALNNGSVFGDGANEDGEKIEVSTIQYPKTLRKYYDPDAISATSAFNQLANEFLHEINHH